MRVLVVDDEQDVRALLVTVLEDAGHHVYELESGLRIVEKTIEFSPDVIVLDITMPSVDGFVALANLKSDPNTRNVPVLMASARGESEMLVKARELGAADFMLKPWEDGELEWRVGECAKRGHQQAA